jgi:long-chain acyl-CoA synthetase
VTVSKTPRSAVVRQNEPTLLDLLRAHPGTPLPGQSAAAVLAEVARVADELRAETREGRRPVLLLPNGREWVVRYLALVSLGATPVLAAPDTPEAEVARLRGLPADAAPGSVLIPTSGSTGAPGLVVRSQHSLVAEGYRYRDGVGLRDADSVLLPVPLAHSYALGFLYGAWLAAATAVAVPPTGLNQISAELEGRAESGMAATVLVLVPPLARLLAARARRQGAGRQRAPRLRLAMVGAGPVDAELQSEFSAAFGIGLARNYGSTELGATVSGPAELPPLTAGRPLPGVRYRLIDPTEDRPVQEGPGRLQLQLSAEPDGRPGPLDDTAPWHDTGDLAVVDPAGVLRILGRRGRAIRRGGRWVSPLEIEAVLRSQPGVQEVAVHGRSTDHDGEDRIVAEVVLSPTGPSLDELRAAAHAHLAPHKVPDEFVPRHTAGRSAAGKLTARPRYRLARAALEAARAYKAAELVFALWELGAVELLSHGADAEQLAAALGCDVATLDWMLFVGHGLGILATAEDADKIDAAEADAYLRLESLLSRSLVTREELVRTARTGPAQRRFEKWAAGAPAAPVGAAVQLNELRSAYTEAMHGRHAQARSVIGLRLLRPAAGAHLVEITAGPGRYLDALLAQDPTATGHLIRIGQLSAPVGERVAQAIEAGAVTPASRLPVGVADVCVIANAVHGPDPGGDLAAVAETLRPGGRVLIDDVFLPDSGSGAAMELGLDWLTHGGTAWSSVAQLSTGIAELGLVVARDLRLGASPSHLVLISDPGASS